MKPTETKLITPAPYYNLIFGCSNRAFYQVKQDLYEIGTELGIDEFGECFSESCDYEGDLDTITLYRGKGIEDCEAFVSAVLKHYEIDEEVPENVNVVLSIS